MPEQERGTKPDMSVLPKLYSIEDVLSIFPTNHKPGIRRLSAFAKTHGCCRKLGRSIAFTREDVDRLLEALSDNAEVPTPRSRITTARRVKPGETYLKARAMLESKRRA